jgi:hypothetical protein
MKNFGLIKTKIEDKLIQSYSKNSFKSELKTFKSLVLENRNALQLYHLYNSLSSPQGHNDDDSRLFLDEAITMINNLKKTVNLEKINEWVKDIKTENRYSDIDIVVEGKVTKLESIITSKKNIVENLKRKKETKEIINLPLKTMLKVANKTLNEAISNLNEKEKTELTSIISLSNNEFKKQFGELKENTIKKLESLLTEQTDTDLTKKVNETLNRIKFETPNNLNFYKLQKLNESL